MAGIAGQIRTPDAPVRTRRNFDGLAENASFIAAGEVIQLNADGALQLVLNNTGGLENNAGELQIELDTNPGLATTADGITAVVAEPILLDANGIGLNIGDGLALSSPNLVVELATDPGLEFSSGDLQVKIKTDGGLVRDADGLSVTGAGVWTVTGVQTGAYTAAVDQLVRCDPSGGAFTVSLPTAVGVAGRSIAIKNTTSSATTITVDGDGSETIDGDASMTISVGYGSVTLISDGTNWMIT